MAQELTAEEYRKQKRDNSEDLSQIIDKYYEGFFEVAKALKNSNIRPGTKIETPYGDFLITPKI